MLVYVIIKFNFDLLYVFDQIVSSAIDVAREDARCAAADDAWTAERADPATPRLREHVPEAQSLVARTRNDGAAVRVHGQVQNSESVPGQRGYLLHGRVLPHNYLIEGIPVRTHQLVARF